MGATQEVRTTSGGLTTSEVGEGEEVEAAGVMEETERDRTALTEASLSGEEISSKGEAAEATAMTDLAAPAPGVTARPTEEAVTDSSLTPVLHRPLGQVTSMSLVTWGLQPGAIRPMCPNIRA